MTITAQRVDTFEALLRVGKARRIRRVAFTESGLKKGSHVVVGTERGTEIGTLVEDPRPIGAPRTPKAASADPAIERMDAEAFWKYLSAKRERKEAERELGNEPDAPIDGATAVEETVTFVRSASAADVESINVILETNEPDEFAFFKRQIAELGLPMKPVQVEHVLGGECILFFFTSEQRVDFRALVPVLARRFQTRIELRRINPREAQAMQKGVGVCGRELCCSTWLKVLPPVTVKMARDQGLAVSDDANLGACGRLRCCLRYEIEGAPKPDASERGGCTGCSTKKR